MQRQNPSSHGATIGTLTSAMAEHGPSIRAELERAVAPSEVKSGHIVGALISMSTKWVEAIEAGDTSTAFRSTVAILWLSRALAHAEGKVSETPAATA